MKTQTIRKTSNIQDNIKEKKVNLKLKILIFVVALFTVSYSMTIDMYVKGDGFFYWMVFWTHLSNLGVLFWSGASLFSYLFKKEKLFLILEGWFFKNLVLTFIIVTGIVFMSVSYIPTLVKYTNINNKANIVSDVFENGGHYLFVENNFVLYSSMIIFGTTMLHLVIPTLLFMELIFNNQPKKEKKGNLNNFDKSMILFIFPSLYFVYAVLSNALGVPGPYAVLNFSNNFANSGHDSYPLWWQVIALFLDILVGIFFVVTSWLILYWQDKKYEKSMI